MTLDQRDEITRRITCQRRAAEVGVLRQIVGGAGEQIGEVATAAAGNADLLAQLVVVLDQEHAATALPRRRGAHHARGTGTHDNDVEAS